MLHGHRCRPNLRPHRTWLHQLLPIGIYRSSKNGRKMPPPTALGRLLVVRRFACPTNWWASCCDNRRLAAHFHIVCITLLYIGLLYGISSIITMQYCVDETQGISKYSVNNTFAFWMPAFLHLFTTSRYRAYVLQTNIAKNYYSSMLCCLKCLQWTIRIHSRKRHWSNRPIGYDYFDLLKTGRPNGGISRTALLA